MPATAVRVLLLAVLVVTSWLGLSQIPAAWATDEAAQLREEAEQLIEKQEWKKASAKLRKLKAKVKGDEREEVAQLIFRVGGEEAWAKLTRSVKKKSKPRAVLARVDKFLRKYGEEPELAKKAGSFRAEWAKKIYTTLENFETSREIDVDLVVVTDPKLVKEGRRAARWTSRSREESSVLFDCPADWSPHHTVVLWVHTREKGGRLTFDAVGTGDDDYFEAWHNLDFVGWKELRLKFQGKKAVFRREGAPSWSDIESFRIWKDEGQGIDIIIDDIRLERN